MPGVNCRLMEVDEYRRRYVVWVPLGGVSANAPALFMLHGGSGTGAEFLRRAGWREKATEEGFVVTFPTAVEHFVLETQRSCFSFFSTTSSTSTRMANLQGFNIPDWAWPFSLQHPLP